MQQNQYDYIITGSGCAGLSLAMHLLQQNALKQKRILLVDEADKTQNDRTWCFWEKAPGLFESIVHKTWDTLWFRSEAFTKALSIAPYRYKMIRGVDFYQHCFAVLKQHPNVHFLKGRVEHLFSDQCTGAIIDGKTYTAEYLFNSILFQKPSLKKKDVWLLQHFKGWLIETDTPAFNPKEATLMDFRPSQKWGTAFCYVLPVSATKALVEYTLFTPSLLPAEEYDRELTSYICQLLPLPSYRILETEFGVIPMTNYKFPGKSKNIINIGTAGGQTKGSSGYTFSFIQQHSKAVAESLSRAGHPFVASTPKRFQFYDSVLLEVLRQGYRPGNEIFTTLFKKNKPEHVLAFLNNATNLPTEARLISSLPTIPFLKAAMRQLL